MALIAATASFAPGNVRHVYQLAVMVKLFGKVQRSQEIVVEHARSIVAVETGELRDSIHAGEIVDDGKKMTGSVIADADHAGYVEFGTGARGAASPGAGPFQYTQSWPGMEAQPYMRPGLDQARGDVLAEFQS